MTDTSERELIRALWKRGYYADRTPSSGTGVMVEDSEVDGHTASPDVWALKPTNADFGATHHALFFEDKHVQKPRAYLDEEQVDGLRRVAQRAGAVAVIAVKWKNTSGHQFTYPKALDRTEGGNYVFREGELHGDETQTWTLDELTE